jgi:phenylacetate-CoA ligase
VEYVALINNGYRYLAKNILLPIYDISKNTKRIEKNKILQKTQWYKKEEIEKIQLNNLKNLINEAYQFVPYYKSLFKENGIRPEEIKKKQDLERIPVLTKEDIQQNKAHLISTKHDEKTLIPYRSGGSTGKQLQFFLSKEQLSWELGSEARAFEWADYHFGDKCLVFWGSPIDIGRAQSSFRQFLMKIDRMIVTDTYVMSEKNIQKYIKKINDYKPHNIRAYTSSIYMIAKYILKHDISIHHPVSVLTAAESLSPDMRNIIETAFDCKVFDYYGSREISSIAAECDAHEGYHISSENVCIEILRNNEQCAPGEAGTVVITNLRSSHMPFLRYQIGDVGVLKEDPCSCGRGLPQLASIEGRISDFLSMKNPDNGQVYPVGPVYPVINAALMEVPLTKCRMIQKEYNKVEFRLVKNEEFSEEDETFLISYFKEYFGEELEIEIKYVDDIPPVSSGKLTTFRSELEAFNANPVS